MALLTIKCFRTTSYRLQASLEKRLDALHNDIRYEVAISRLHAAILGIIACAYTLGFIAANITGARDPNMLSIWQIDEYAQYPVAIHLANALVSSHRTLCDLLCYNYYTYGYPFFLTSALVAAPAQHVAHLFSNVSATTIVVLALRQMSPLFTAMSTLLLVYLWTGFRSLLGSTLLFVFLATIPAVFNNDMWWHPDSLAILFVVLTIFSLVRDDLRFGRWFYFSAISCGLATGTKVIGLYFFLSICVYLILGIKKGIRISAISRYGIRFCSVMVAVVVATNPLLLVPSTAITIINTLRWQASMNTYGWGVHMSSGPVAWYSEVLENSFGYWWLYIIAIGILIAGAIWDQKRRILNIIVLTWIVPLSLFFLFTVAHKEAYYFIPVALPLLSSLGNPLIWTRICVHFRRPSVAFLACLLLLSLCFQAQQYLDKDIRSYSDAVNREAESPAVAFYHVLQQRYLSQFTRSKRVKVLHDPSIYLPLSTHFDESIRWRCIDYGDVSTVKPELIILLKSSIDTFSQSVTVNNSFNRQQALRSLPLYRDAENGAIKGFQRVANTNFAIAFARVHK